MYIRMQMFCECEQFVIYCNTLKFKLLLTVLKKVPLNFTVKRKKITSLQDKVNLAQGFSDFDKIFLKFIILKSG